jgi:phosphatidate cytidylyltransferase
MSEPGRWGDLGPRVVSAIVMIVVGVAALWAGGAWFYGLAVLAGAVMGWELARLCGAAGAVPVMIGLLFAVVLYLADRLPSPWTLLPVLVAILLTMPLVPRMRLAWLLYGALILVGVMAVTKFREAGVPLVAWLIAVVVASDIAGYFAGRVLGGPKFWPRLSPKKTWSGTVAGWIAAALVGAGFKLAGGGTSLILFSPLLALAAQLGDIAESAVKRRAGAKDASALIPGHGGLMDRFDALIGAATALYLAGAIAGLPVAG